MRFVPGTSQLILSTAFETLLCDPIAQRWNSLLKASLNAVALSDKGQLVAFGDDGSSSTTIQLAALETEKAPRFRVTGAIKPGSGRVSSPSFSSDGSTLIASVGGRSSFWRWDLRHGAQPEPLTSESVFTAVTADGKSRWVTGHQSTTFTMYEGKEVLWTKQLARRMEIKDFSPSGKYLIAAPLVTNFADTKKDGDNAITLYDTSNGETKDFALSRPVTQVEVSPDDKYLAAIDFFHEEPESRFSILQVWDIASGELKITVKEPHLQITGVAFSLNSQRLAELSSFQGKRRIRTWDLETREVEQTVEDLPSEANLLGFWPDNRTIAYSPPPGVRSVRTIYLYNLSKRQERFAFDVPAGTTIALGAAKSGLPLLAVAGEGNNLTLWDADGRNRLTIHALPESGWIETTPEGYFLASTNAEKYVRWRSGNGVLSLLQNQRNYAPERVAQSVSGSTNLSVASAKPGTVSSSTKATSIASSKPATPKPAAPIVPRSAWARQQLTPQADEIALHGSVQRLFPATKTFLLLTDSFSLPSGKTNRIAQPKPKLIHVHESTTMLSGEDSVTWERLHAGSVLLVAGKDSGSGNMLEARCVGILLTR
jgi:WD40 repeat protein